jgi:hypothetical protein
LDFFDIAHYNNALSPVGVFSRLHDPCVVGYLEPLLDLLNFLFLSFILVAVILKFSLSFFLIGFNGFLPLFFHLLDVLFQLVVITFKLLVIWIVDAMACMERQGQNLEWVLAEHLIIASHVDKQSFFVG